MTDATKTSFDHLVGRVVEFGAGIDECESYIEVGMWGRILRITDCHDDCYKFYIKLDEFDEHNIPLETSNYYDKQGQARLTAREAGHYEPEDSIYLPEPAQWDKYFVIKAEGEDVSALLAEYIANPGEARSYTHWLELKVLALKGETAKS
jgi:hypothetical protein